MTYSSDIMCYEMDFFVAAKKFVAGIQFCRSATSFGSDTFFMKRPPPGLVYTSILFHVYLFSFFFANTMIFDKYSIVLPLYKKKKGMQYLRFQNFYYYNIVFANYWLHYSKVKATLAQVSNKPH